jgi:hypothetical protein
MVYNDLCIDAARIQRSAEPLAITVMKPEIGRFGSVIYGK